MAQPFDARALTPLGEPFLVAPQGSTTTSQPQVAAGAGGGTLVYGSNLRATAGVLTWMDRRGQSLGTVGPVANYRGVALSRDGLFATTSRLGDGQFLYDLARNSEQRFSTALERNSGPGAWSQDGNSVVFNATLDGVRGIYRKPANGSGKTELLLPSPTNIQIPADLSSTGTLVFTEVDPKTGADIWSVSTLGGGGAHTGAVSGDGGDGVAAPAVAGRPLAGLWVRRERPGGSVCARISVGAGLRQGVEPRGDRAALEGRRGRTVFQGGD